jgi:hypothetical protein
MKATINRPDQRTATLIESREGISYTAGIRKPPHFHALARKIVAATVAFEVVLLTTAAAPVRIRAKTDRLVFSGSQRAGGGVDFQRDNGSSGDTEDGGG